MGLNSFGTEGEVDVGGRRYSINRLGRLPSDFGVERLPFSLKILLENLLRREDGINVTHDDIAAVAAGSGSGREIAFSPARILLQDFTGVPCVVDLAAMRDAVAALGGDPSRVNPQIPVDLVIDHSVIVDVARRP
ncbi:MAG TPA: aconitase family protein, partial [Acidimicrobiales bacterium]|nr:aconitase family protein [Acidimicrobiales bacterium]